jgi:GT2 family glycosyltransferase
MDVSIIIVNWNARDLIRPCLESIYRETRGVSFEVIVVDNLSSDGSVEMLRDDFPSVKLIASDVNRGFAGGNNVGMAVSTGRYLLLLNPDTLVRDNAIAKMVQFADVRPEAGVVGPRVLNMDGTLQRSCFLSPSVLNLLLSTFGLHKLSPKSSFFGREIMSWCPMTEERPVDVVSGCCMLVRRDAYRQVGGMDETYFMYFEETDWCYRIREAGWQVVYTPGAEITHLGGACTERVKSDMMAQHAASLLLFFRKHKGTLAYLVACLLQTVFFLLRMPFWLFQALFSTRRRYALYRVGICVRIALGAACGGGGLHYRGRTPCEQGDIDAAR